MTKTDLVEKIQASIGLSRKDAAVMLESVFSIMKESLEAGETIKISGFGSFVVSRKAARRGRNPQTGEAITIEARKVLTFKPGSVLRDAINGEAV
ncbi:integration host factor subunit alpha [Trichlorobacter lovleyi]|uniref:Integration host factor subunit alpha n=1 Tax=Trichlorobacter lovleyi (strain ATCC BAA-1151 / DSM 17278 / SZ) TaxID=398767 RepID=B3E585_TRIL1|nr:integration host factor subunit alpha [Trichlorobacter lovleyi]ACD96072.1 histone family protein DNA-binding protein [Trichlorobacter lovleyi SZ]